MKSKMGLTNLKCLSLMLALPLFVSAPLYANSAAPKVKPVNLGRVATAQEKEMLMQSRSQRMGGGDTGGGSVVLCVDPQNKIKSIEVYDLYEAKRRYGFTSNFEKAGSTEDALNLALKRLYAADPVTASQIATQIDLFSADSTILDDAAPPYAKDLDAIVIPDESLGCKIISTILQRTPTFPEEKQFFINGKIWKAMVPEQRAAIILHEVLLQRVRAKYSNDIVTSTGARYVNARVWANNLKELSIDEYNQQISRLIYGESTFVAKGLIINHEGKVFEGKIQTNLGIFTPTYIRKQVSEGSRANEELTADSKNFFNFPGPVVLDIQETKVCLANGCINNVSKIQIDNNHRVLSVYSFTDKADRTTLHVTTLSADGQINGKFSGFADDFPSITYAPNQDQATDQLINLGLFSNVRKFFSSIGKEPKEYYFLIVSGTESEVFAFMYGEVKTCILVNRTTRMGMALQNQAKGAILYTLNNGAVVSRKMISKQFDSCGQITFEEL